MDSDMNTNEELAQEILSLIGSNERYNIFGREHTWYGLWNRTLRFFEKSKILKNCAVFPQYPVWFEMPQEGLSLDTTYETTDPDDMILAGKKVDDIDPFPLITEPATSNSGSHNDDTEAAKNEKLLMSVLQNTSPQSWVDEPRPPSPSDFIVHNNPAPVSTGDAVRSELRRAINERNEQFTSHKVTDFSILYIIWSKVNTGGKLVIKIHNIFVPVIIEVKFYRSFYRDHHEQKSMQHRVYRMHEAKGSVLLQVANLLSQRKQRKVIAIAVAGSFWCWREFKDSDVRGPDGNFQNPDPQIGAAYWSRDFLLGTDGSNAEFGVIEEWVKRFIDNPKGNTRIPEKKTGSTSIS